MNTSDDGIAHLLRPGSTEGKPTKICWKSITFSSSERPTARDYCPFYLERLLEGHYDIEQQETEDEEEG